MEKFFNWDAPVIQFLSKMGQMMITSLVWLLCCLPVFTVGAATTAMYRVMFNLKEDRACSLKEYFRAFRENFRKATLLWLILLLCMAVLTGLYFLVMLVENDILRLVSVVIFCILFFVVYISGLYVFPLTSYFENTVPATIRNAVGMGLGNLRQSIIACAVTFIPLVVMMLSMKLFIVMLFLWIVLGPGAIAYGVVCALTPVFRCYAPENEEVF